MRVKINVTQADIDRAETEKNIGFDSIAYTCPIAQACNRQLRGVSGFAWGVLAEPRVDPTRFKVSTTKADAWQDAYDADASSAKPFSFVLDLPKRLIKPVKRTRRSKKVS